MNKTIKKTLSIILAILMLVTSVPFAFAADEAPDFSDAKVITSDSDGKISVDGVELEMIDTYNRSVVLPAGNYKLTGDISTNYHIFTDEGATIALDLNGYVWDLKDKEVIIDGVFSIYDTSENETGKLTTSCSSGTITVNREGCAFCLYSGTVESTSLASNAYTVASTRGNSYLYGGKLISKVYNVRYPVAQDITVKVVDTVFECGEGYSEILGVTNFCEEVQSVVDVSDYTGDSLTVDLEIGASGFFRAFKGIKNAEEAEKYHINVTVTSVRVLHEKTEYDETTGEKYVYIAENAFTQQPTAENNYTIDFNNPDASFQWYEVKEIYADRFVAEEGTILFTFDFKQGDLLNISTDSELESVQLRIFLGNETELSADKKDMTYRFREDKKVTVFTRKVLADNPVELEISIIREIAVEGETGKTLYSGCEGYYCCKSVFNGIAVDTSDAVYTDHNIIADSYLAPTCTETGLTEGSHCSRCDDMTVVQDVIPALGHTDAEADYICDTCGEHIYCEDCGKDHSIFINRIFCYITQFFIRLFTFLGFWE